MPSDALHYSFMAKELDERLRDGKIEKITMPEKDEIILTVRSRGENSNLLISAAASSARCHLTSRKKENPVAAPSFLMHLRKHIGGAKIIGISAEPFERVLKIKLATRNEMSDVEYKTLAVEIMGKYSNIILVGSDGKISDCIKKVGADLSSKRQVLPALKYLPAPAQDRVALTDSDAVQALLCSFGGGNLPDYIIRNMKGLAPVSAQEAVFAALGRTDCEKLSADEVQSVQNALAQLYRFDNVMPCIRKTDGADADFYIRPYKAFGGEYAFFPTLSAAMDEYFYDKDKAIRFGEKSHRLSAILKNAISRTEKKLAGFIEKTESCRDADRDRLYGELILANIYRIKQGMSEFTAEDWNDGGKLITVPLAKEKTPQANAQQYFKRYAKKKKTIEQTMPLCEKAKADLDYFDTVLISFSLCRENSEIDDLTEELERAGLLKPKQTKKKAKAKRIPSMPMTFSFEGFTIRVGKNNIQNDTLTKNAKADDIWLHTKSIHGSHTLISAEGRTVPDSVILYAASLAAKFSKASASQNVPVDYTFVKYVNKPSGAPVGKVIYTHQKTVYVNPAKDIRI